MKLRELMNKRGYSFSDLATASGVGRATITRIAYGQAKEPHPSTKRKLAEVLKVEIAQIDEFTEPAVMEVEDTAATELPVHAKDLPAILAAFDSTGREYGQEEVDQDVAGIISNHGK